MSELIRSPVRIIGSAALEDLSARVEQRGWLGWGVDVVEDVSRGGDRAVVLVAFSPLTDTIQENILTQRSSGAYG